jgi:uncharacterized protein (TIGR00290 family)
MRQDPSIEVVSLLTTVNSEFARVAMHSTRRDLLGLQARATGLPLASVELPWPCSNEAYEAAMAAAFQRLRDDGVEVVAFGDLFLGDVRAYRERLLEGMGLEPVFPLWQRPTRQLAREMIGAGLRAKVVCLDPTRMPLDFIGRDFDDAMLAALPTSVDPCGERGEFHTFCYAGPMFTQPLSIALGEVMTRDGFCFQDLRSTGCPD